MYRSVFKVMREQKGGIIFNISSIAGYVPSALGSPYSASKHAITALSGCLNSEGVNFGIKCVNVMPGGFKTDFFKNTSFKTTPAIIEEYDTLREDAYKGLSPESMGKFLIGDPKKAAEVLIKVSNMEQPPLYLFLGEDAFENALKQIEKVKSDM
ncbi:3-oxoacyl-acyl-carrier protein reductase, putative [Entamoeba invadens IP1]|uniref:3-oxoacyl-acyl-carrier protein reductase, putative n=1 Tax=Entamoeba invadens IP1 TaxID=370355 RepID=A0A0A1U5I3_ENTIV|nr:3-oxoacyl-acyl-carrier protein reductase, putative [Entamoeba invadens IP1]ELP89487.1 3-oxoacyl-acyl-carrier protein reductase, putative [Entamoeba invadens IP1]|eukprot:XP_004256258.1 3-oxoacyl-acyl-carrier protein reductase, putative [Entamoeba invadens IP1]